jgi:glycine hydroxymethyltransferase
VAQIAEHKVEAIAREIYLLTEQSRITYDHSCLNLNPASNVMNPRAEALLAQGLGTRPSLGYPGAKHEMGIEAIEKIEVITAELSAEVFDAHFVELRVFSGALANLYAFMATTKPGDTIIAPAAVVGGHVTHHTRGAAGLYGLVAHEAPADPKAFSVDLDRLRNLAQRHRPKLVTIGGSINLLPHPVHEIRKIADDVGAWVLYDAAHMAGPIAGHVWQQPLEEGAHVVTMSTYKSLGGPPGGLIVTNEPVLAKRIEEIAFPGLTANFDVAKTAGLAISLLDWKSHGRAYSQMMLATALALAEALDDEGLPVYFRDQGYTRSHQLALEAARYGGGQAAARRLRQANILACGIALPLAAVDGDFNGLRLGTNEIVRWGMQPEDMKQLASFISRALRGNEDLSTLAAEVTAFRRIFDRIHFVI